MTALQAPNQPLMIRLPDGRLIPVDSGALDTPPPPAAPVAASMGDGGALGPPPVMSAGQQNGGGINPAGALAPTPTNVIPFRQAAGGGGVARGGALLEAPRQPAPIQATQDPTGGLNIGALIKKLGGAAGASAAPGPDTTDPEGTNLPAGQEAPDDGPSSILAHFKKAVLGINDNAALPMANPAAAVAQPGSGALQPQPTQPVTAPQSGGIFSRIGAALGIGPDGDKPGSHDPLVRSGVDPQLIENRYGSAYQEPGYFDRLRDNPTAMALLTGGLGTMVAASRPGATVGGAIGEGALGGLQSVYAEKDAQRDEAIKAAKEQSENDLRKAQGAFYGQRGDVLQQNADTAGQKADTGAQHADDLAAHYMAGDAANQKKADAAMVRAQAASKGTSNPTALMKNAQFLVDNKMAPDIETAVSTLKTAATNPGQRSSLYNQRAKLILSTNLNPQPNDMTNAMAVAKMQIDGELANAMPAKVSRIGAPAPQAPKINPPGGPAQNVGALRQQAQAAIKNGAPPDAVKKRFKSMAGQDL